MPVDYHYRAFRMLDSMDIQDHLEAWGLWVLADGNGLGYSSPMSAIMREYVVEPSSRKKRFTRYITDDDALIIERYVTKLCQRRPLEGKILRLKYIDRMGDRTIAREYLTPLKYGKDSAKQVGSSQATNLVAFAEGFITAAMINDGYQ